MTIQATAMQDDEHTELNILDWSLRDMAGFLPDAIIILDATMRILYLNSAAEALFGYSQTDVIGLGLDIFIPQQYKHAHHDHVLDFPGEENNTHWMGENRIVYGQHRNGYLIPLEIPITRRKYQNQTFFICAPRNNHERLAYEQAINESEQRYRGVIDSQHTLVVRVDREGRFVFANQAYCTMFGKNLDELVGSSFTPLVHPDDLPLTLEAMKELEKPPYRAKVTQRAMTMSGWRWIAWEDSVIHDPSKNLYEIQAVGVDVTEHKRVEEELSNKIALLSGLFNSIPDIVFYKDAQGIYLGANQEFARLVGKSVNEIVNKSDYDLFSPETADFFRENDRIMMEQGKQRNNEEWIKYPDGEQVLLDTLKAPLYDSYGQTIGVLGISRDITARKKIEEIAIGERNLAIILAQKSTVAEALPLVLDLALHVSDMDCGGIYLVDRQSQDLVLMNQIGLSDDFAARANRFNAGSGQHKVVMEGNAIYQPYLQLPTSKNQVAINEGLHISAIIPVKFNDKVIACLNVASHTLDDLPGYRRNALENFAFQIGNMIARFETQTELVESQRELQSMFDSLQDYVFVLDGDDNIIQVNQAMLDSLGYSIEELIGTSILKLHPVEQYLQTTQVLHAVHVGLAETFPTDLRRKDGSYISVETKVVNGRWGSQDVLIGVSRDITERRITELRLRQLSQAVEQSPSSIVITDLSGNMEYVNPKFTQVTGYSIEEALGQNPRILKSGRTETETHQHMWKTLRAGLEWRGEFHNRKKNGELFWESAVIAGVTDNDNKITHYVAIKDDITGRKAAEELHSEQNRLLEYRHRFVETITSISTRFINMPSSEINPEISGVLKQIGELEQVDRSYVFLLDQDNTRMTNTHEWCAPGIESQINNMKNIPTSNFPWWMAKLEKLEEVHIPMVSQLPTEAQAERELLVMQSVQSVLAVPLVSHNTLIGFLGFDLVLNQRFWTPDSILLIKLVGDLLSNALMSIRMQNDLIQSETRKTALLSAVPDLIFRIRRDGTFLDYKASSPELLAVPTDHIVGSSIKNALPDPLFKETMRHIEQVLQSKETETMEYTLKIGDSSHVFEARFKDSGADEVTAIVREISDRARLEQMKSDFINRATHELRTPITTMLLMVNLIDGGVTDENYQEYWEILKSELNRERLLVEDLLIAGRLESHQANFHFRSVDSADVLKKAILQVKTMAKEKDVLLSLHPFDELDETTYIINADEKAITQVFINLLGNAIKFTPAGGKVDVFLKRQIDGIDVSIIDTGMGIPSEDIPLLFNRFFRGTNAIQEEIQGTGIGLFIVGSILNEHGGRVKVHSNLGSGSQFDIWLPFDHR